MPESDYLENSQGGSRFFTKLGQMRHSLINTHKKLFKADYSLNILLRLLFMVDELRQWLVQIGSECNGRDKIDRHSLLFNTFECLKPTCMLTIIVTKWLRAASSGSFNYLFRSKFLLYSKVVYHLCAQLKLINKTVPWYPLFCGVIAEDWTICIVN